jgi:hypothetical protein
MLSNSHNPHSLLAIKSPQDIVRDDGTHLAIFEATDFRTEVKGCLYLMKDWFVKNNCYHIALLTGV